MKKNIGGTGWLFPNFSNRGTRISDDPACSRSCNQQNERRERRPRKSSASDSTRVYTCRFKSPRKSAPGGNQWSTPISLTLSLLPLGLALTATATRPKSVSVRKTPIVLQTLKLNNAFPTKEEAENFALEAAKKWIDDKNSRPSQGITQSTVDAKSETPLG